MAWGKKKKDKKAKVNVVPRPKPAAAKAVPAPKPGAKPIGPELKPVAPAAHGKSKNVVPVKIHMLGNALIDGVQYKANVDYTVPMSTYKAIGTSCVSTAKWRAIQAKGGIGSLHK